MCVDSQLYDLLLYHTTCSYRISDGSLLVGVANASIPLAVLSPVSLVVPIVGLIHQEFVQKVIQLVSCVLLW